MAKQPRKTGAPSGQVESPKRVDSMVSSTRNLIGLFTPAGANPMARSSGDLSDRQKRDKYIKSRWRIFRAAPVYGGMFRSHHSLMDPEHPEVPNSWMDIWFLGLERRTTWGAGIFTAINRFEGAVEDLARERTQALLTEEEREADFRMELEPFFRGGEKLWRLSFPERPVHASLGGLTSRDYEEKLRAEIRAQEPPVVYESFQIHPGYLEIVVDAPRLDRAVIEQAILRFRALGEQSWISPDPVPLERLRGEGGQAVS